MPTDPRAALAGWLETVAATSNDPQIAREAADLAERGVLLVTEDQLAVALLNAGWRNAVGDAAAIFAALSGEAE